MQRREFHALCEAMVNDRAESERTRPDRADDVTVDGPVRRTRLL